MDRDQCEGEFLVRETGLVCRLLRFLHELDLNVMARRRGEALVAR